MCGDSLTINLFTERILVPGNKKAFPPQRHNLYYFTFGIHNFYSVIREAAKKLFFLMARPLIEVEGGLSKDRATKKKFFFKLKE